MEFLAVSLLALILLGLSTVAVVEAGYLLGRMYSRVSFWFRYRHLLWSSQRQVNALKRAYGRRGKSPRLGALRFTRSRSEEFRSAAPAAGESETRPPGGCQDGYPKGSARGVKDARRKP